jgi:hypothetical protein
MKMIAISGIIVSGIAVPKAARTLPTAPWPRPRRTPTHSTPLVKSSAAKRMRAKEIRSSGRVVVNADHREEWNRTVARNCGICLYIAASLNYDPDEDIGDERDPEGAGARKNGRAQVTQL